MTPGDGGGLGQRWIIYLGIEGFGFVMSIRRGRRLWYSHREPPALRLAGFGMRARLTC